ncbi:hypothetical protein GE09DRAFT_1186036 [Coniochaeta sp. 2T2.1]|nr:hypothetical protein GE09DRAFT_1186036 [Coniochaeta sp. 2T2.1]
MSSSSSYGHGSETDSSDGRGHNVHTRFKLSHNPIPGPPRNTAGLGTMTRAGYLGGDDNPATRVCMWHDSVRGGIWASAPGKDTGHLTFHDLANKQQKYGDREPPRAAYDDALVTLPTGEKARTLYLLDPREDFYEPLGDVPDPAQAHVVNRWGYIILTTCPLLLRIADEGDEAAGRWQRHVDVAARAQQFGSFTQTMTLFDHDIDDNVYLWKDDVLGGIWKTTTPDNKFGTLRPWDGQADVAAAGLVPMQRPAAPFMGTREPPRANLYLADPVNEVVGDEGDGHVTVRSVLVGESFEVVSYPQVRMVNRLSITEEEQVAELNDPESLYQVYLSDYEDSTDSEDRAIDSDTDSVFDEELDVDELY